MLWKLRIAETLLAFALLLSVSNAWADGKLTAIDNFTDSSSNELGVYTFFEPDATGPDSKKVALLGIKNGARRISIAFDPEDWPALISLWTKAVAAQSNSWHDVGVYVETGTSDVSTLKMSAGPGVTFLISSPAKGIETYLLSATDMTRFNAAVQKAQHSLANQTSD
jgi:hypothetical protein